MAEIEELRAQPQDIQAEQSVLGAIFIDEGKLVFVREFIEPADFFKSSKLEYQDCEPWRQVGLPSMVGYN